MPRKARRRAIAIGSAIALTASVVTAVVVIRRRRRSNAPRPGLPTVGSFGVTDQGGTAPPKPTTTGADSQAPTHTADDIVHVDDASFNFPASGSAVGEIPLVELDYNANGTLYLDIVIRVYPSPSNNAFGAASLCGSYSQVVQVIAGSKKSDENELGYGFCPDDAAALQQGVKLTELGVVQHGRVLALRVEARDGLYKHDAVIAPEYRESNVKNGTGDREPFTADVEVRWRWEKL